jgi:hypothetical protein
LWLPINGYALNKKVTPDCIQTSSRKDDGLLSSLPDGRFPMRLTVSTPDRRLDGARR